MYVFILYFFFVQQKILFNLFQDKKEIIEKIKFDFCCNSIRNVDLRVTYTIQYEKYLIKTTYNFHLNASFFYFRFIMVKFLFQIAQKYNTWFP